MEKNVRITKKAALSAILAYTTVITLAEGSPVTAEDIRKYAANELEKLSKSATKGGLTKKEIEEREADDAVVLAGLPATPSTVFNLTKTIAGCENWTTQKMTSVLKRLVESGRAVKTTFKGSSMYGAKVEG